ncbi:unnamed protein product [Protopolystoma xenopodis]|uniref:Uncharacterized protein n=1 Tax=Protopolystoma xenopodis TaxID=117903 RepID=A0A3S5CSK7_9PLAT|nr:unnamed protein product [Protopolystoma xenopodis]
MADNTVIRFYVYIHLFSSVHALQGNLAPTSLNGFFPHAITFNSEHFALTADEQTVPAGHLPTDTFPVEIGPTSESSSSAASGALACMPPASVAPAGQASNSRGAIRLQGPTTVVGLLPEGTNSPASSSLVASALVGSGTASASLLPSEVASTFLQPAETPTSEAKAARDGQSRLSEKEARRERADREKRERRERKDRDREDRTIIAMDENARNIKDKHVSIKLQEKENEKLKLKNDILDPEDSIVGAKDSTSSLSLRKAAAHSTPHSAYSTPNQLAHSPIFDVLVPSHGVGPSITSHTSAKKPIASWPATPRTNFPEVLHAVPTTFSEFSNLSPNVYPASSISSPAQDSAHLVPSALPTTSLTMSQSTPSPCGSKTSMKSPFNRPVKIASSKTSTSDRTSEEANSWKFNRNSLSSTQSPVGLPTSAFAVSGESTTVSPTEEWSEMMTDSGPADGQTSGWRGWRFRHGVIDKIGAAFSAAATYMTTSAVSGQETASGSVSGSASQAESSTSSPIASQLDLHTVSLPGRI